MFNREPQVEIPSEGCKTALGSGGRYFTTAEGVVYVTDPPIEVHLLSLERDFPGWEEVVPWRVILRPRKLLDSNAQGVWAISSPTPGLPIPPDGFGTWSGC